MSESNPPTALVPVEPQPFNEDIRVPKSPGESAILEAIERLDRKMTTHGERLDSHGGRLDAHDSILQTHNHLLQAHSQMLTKHAEMHTDHARGIIAAQEHARHANQSSSDLARESRTAMEAIGRHMATVAKANADKLDAIVMASAQTQEQNRFQTIALDKLVEWKASPWFRAAVVAGAFFGGVVVAVVSRLLAGH